VQLLLLFHLFQSRGSGEALELLRPGGHPERG
jgi:hypothetical protein